MASDYGDEAGEKMVDDFMRFGERMGERAMYERAHRIQRACENATREAMRSAGGDAPEPSESPEWAKLDMAEFRRIEGYDGIKGIIEAKLAARGVESAWFADPKTGKEYLLFRITDAREVWSSFDELGREAGRAGELAAEALRRRERAEPEKGRDDRPLDERAASARGAAEALEAQRATTKSLERGARPREARAR